MKILFLCFFCTLITSLYSQQKLLTLQPEKKKTSTSSFCKGPDGWFPARLYVNKHTPVTNTTERIIRLSFKNTDTLHIITRWEDGYPEVEAGVKDCIRLLATQNFKHVCNETETSKVHVLSIVPADFIPVSYWSEGRQIVVRISHLTKDEKKQAVFCHGWMLRLIP